ncbi:MULTISPECIES: hypothetical protein [Rhodococcus]|uniref:Uncharacterized protein n=1 Tax=Rhodococcus opacus RKJ300 = JCM 13270 TaxID=1165867 RepID=I0WM22_RHOOP|nr:MULTISPECIES: hypothetical protein [Rhodococcus]EID77438.1 hypothetical protein W59_23860 [Rhodococcus opacus RKJ300 = JCM 13270]QQZ19447.1 hypothetical protein GO592_40185 [Rhodococcus sp. 21391]
MNAGDRVKVHADATSEFVIVSIDGEDAVIESVRDDVLVGSPSMPALSDWSRSSPDPVRNAV